MSEWVWIDPHLLLGALLVLPVQVIGQATVQRLCRLVVHLHHEASGQVTRSSLPLVIPDLTPALGVQHDGLLRREHAAFERPVEVAVT